MTQKRRQHSLTEGFRPWANPEQAHWMRELRKSSATQRHTPKPRKGTRREKERQAIRDQNRGDQR
ncbi:hypothetical protein [Paenarthrobacter sp. YJN-5]|uniref:hypothetical protein n=1 Tax=Paenarthrobacter sp. YJN-5 TaxID=2735316 RepID=UPI001877F691|nr:hypothetical protein [Paenarthrobacter sp. YJN-5]QOT16730.1 hypothetical protein HMI59_09050 [Paenarthrobacter sp. YJN-5]